MSLLSRLAIVTGEDPHFVSFFVFITVDMGFVEAYDAAIFCTIMCGVIPDVQSQSIRFVILHLKNYCN